MGLLGSEVVNMIEYPFFPYADEGRPFVVGLLYEMIMAVNWELVPFAPNPILFHLAVLFSYIKYIFTQFNCSLPEYPMFKFCYVIPANFSKELFQTVLTILEYFVKSLVVVPIKTIIIV